MATAGKKGSKAAPSSRGDIVNDVAAKTDLPQTKVDQVVRAYEETIVSELARGGEVRINGFGTFKVSHRAARTARNPQTGGTVPVPARNVPRFTPSAAFKLSVGGPKSSKGGAKGGAAKGGAGKGGAAKGGAKAGAAKGGAAKGGAAKGGAKGGAGKGGRK